MAKKSSTKGSTKTTTRNQVMVFVDDIGNLGKKMKEKGRRAFGFGIAVVNKPDKYAAVSTDYKKRKAIKGEFKAMDVKKLRDKIYISFRIRRSGAKTYGYYVDKNKDPPKGWKEQGGSDTQVGILYRSIDLTLSKIRSKDVTVVVDRHTAYNTKDDPDRVKPMSGSLSKKHDKNVTCTIEGKKKNIYVEHLQTTDAVSHAIKERIEDGSPWMSLIMGQKLKRLTKKDDIRIKK